MGVKGNKRKRRGSEVPSGLRHCATPKIYKVGSFLRVSLFVSARILTSRIDQNPVFIVELIARYFQIKTPAWIKKKNPTIIFQ